MTVPVQFMNYGVGAMAIREPSGKSRWAWNADNSPNATWLTAQIAAAAAELAAAGYGNSYLRYLWWSQGNGDVESIPGTYSKADYKTDLESVYGEWIDTFPNLRIGITPLHRSTGGTSNAGWQAVRDVNNEHIDSGGIYFFAGEMYDLDLSDGVTHLNDSDTDSRPATQEMGRRASIRIAADRGKRSANGTLGPSLSAASRSGAVITGTFAMDDNANINVPAAMLANPAQLWAFEDSGGVLIPTAMSFDGVDEFSLTLPSTPSGSSPRLIPVYGHCKNLAATNAVVIKDENNLPLRSRPVAIT